MNDASFYPRQRFRDIDEYLHGVVDGEMLDILAKVFPQ